MPHLGFSPLPDTEKAALRLTYQQAVVQDIKQLYAGTSGWDLDYMQLSPGPLAMRHQTADCGEVRVERFTFNQAVALSRCFAQR